MALTFHSVLLLVLVGLFKTAWSRDASPQEQLISAALDSRFAFDRLSYMCDTFGPRLSGAQNLENAMDWILAEMETDNLDKVHAEDVQVTQWKRGSESLQLVQPRTADLAVLALGHSIGTGDAGVVGEALVVNNFTQLHQWANQARGKIVVYNVPFTTYGATVQYRTTGAVEAAKVGAIASLVRSVTPMSLYTPHTGTMGYQSGVEQIPAAAITVEDAMMLQRFQDRGDTIVLRLTLGASGSTLPPVTSRNVIAEITGSTHPEEVVVIGGHIDSWDVGQGAMDDGGGCMISWEAIRLMRALNLRPKRTVRAVLFTDEEKGGAGGRQYFLNHKDEVNNTVLAMESDSGVFQPKGFGFSGSAEARKQLEGIVTKYLSKLDLQIFNGGGGADIAPLMQAGVPGMSLAVDETKYFWYHHTNADTMDKLSLEEFNRCVAAWAVMSYSVADLPGKLPRGPQ